MVGEKLEFVLDVDDRGRAKIQRFNRSLKKTDTQTSKTGKALANMGITASRVFAVAGGAAAGAAVAAIKAGSDFESAFTGVLKTVDDAGASISELTPIGEELRQGFLDLSQDIPVAATELAGIGEIAGQLGIESENILGFTRTVADLGATTVLSSGEAAISLARLANITQLPQEQISNLGSAVVDLGNNFATNEAEILNFGKRIAAAGNIIGLSEGEILGFGAAISSVGVQAQAGGTAISKTFISISDAVQSGGQTLDLFAQTAGMSTASFRQAFEEDAAGAVTSFIEGLGRIKEEGGNTFAVLEELELQDQRLIRALLSAAGAGDELRKAINLGNEAFEDNTALTTEAEQRYGTFASQVKVLLNQLTALGIELFEVLRPILVDTVIPALRAAVSATKSLSNIFASLPGPIKAILSPLHAVGGALSSLGGAFQSVQGFGSAALETFGLIGTDSKKASGDAVQAIDDLRESQNKGTKEFKAAQDRLEEINKRVAPEYFGWVVDIRKITDDASDSTEDLTDEQIKLKEAFEDQIRPTRKLVDKFRTLKGAGFDTNVILKEMSGAMFEAIKKHGELGTEVDPLVARLFAENQEFFNLTGVVKDGTSALSFHETEVGNVKDAYRKWREELQPLKNTELQEFADKLKPVNMLNKDLNDQINRGEGIPAIRVATNEASEAAKNYKTEINATFDRLGSRIADAIVDWEGFGQAFKDTGKAFLKATVELFVDELLNPIKPLIKSLVSFVTGLFSKALGGLGSLFGSALGGIFGGGGSSGGGGGASSGAGAAGGAIGTFFGGPLGGFLGTAAGSLLGGLLGGGGGKDKAIEENTRFLRIAFLDYFNQIGWPQFTSIQEIEAANKDLRRSMNEKISPLLKWIADRQQPIVNLLTQIRDGQGSLAVAAATSSSGAGGVDAGGGSRDRRDVGLASPTVNINIQALDGSSVERVVRKKIAPEIRRQRALRN